MGELFTQFDRMNKINRTMEKQMETLNDQVNISNSDEKDKNLL